MTTKKLLPRAVLAALLLALPAAADAPRDPPQYAQFDSDTKTIKDNFTKLEWDRRAVFAADFSGAGASCKLLQSLLGPGVAGRLPTVKELLTIVDEEPHDEYEFGKVVSKTIDALAFADTPVDQPYWSSTPAPGGLVWTVSFATGQMAPLAKTATANARCVR